MNHETKLEKANRILQKLIKVDLQKSSLIHADIRCAIADRDYVEADEFTRDLSAHDTKMGRRYAKIHRVIREEIEK